MTDVSACMGLGFKLTRLFNKLFYVFYLVSFGQKVLLLHRFIKIKIIFNDKF